MLLVLQNSGQTLEDQVLTNEGIPVIVVTCVNFIEQYGKHSLSERFYTTFTEVFLLRPPLEPTKGGFSNGLVWISSGLNSRT